MMVDPVSELEMEVEVEHEYKPVTVLKKYNLIFDIVD